MSNLINLSISDLDESAINKSKCHWHGVCKPLGSLGIFEDMIVRLAGIYGTEDVRIDKRCVIVVCGDNGVVEEGISQSDHSVTTSVAREIADGKSNINIMANAVHADVIVADIGMKDDIDHAKILNMKIANGTKNIVNQPAMTLRETIGAVNAGISLAKKAKEKGYAIIATGEMGIGNTTTSAAIAAVLLDEDAADVAGRGAGLSDEGLLRKITAIRKAIMVNAPTKDDAMDILSKLGGYDIAAMTGIFLGGAQERLPVIIDGFISSVAAALAYMIEPLSREYMFASHVSDETSARSMLEFLKLRPVIDAGMRLGEGTGAVCLLPLLDIALSEYHNAHRFEETDIEQYEEQI